MFGPLTSQEHLSQFFETNSKLSRSQAPIFLSRRVNRVLGMYLLSLPGTQIWVDILFFLDCSKRPCFFWGIQLQKWKVLNGC